MQILIIEDEQRNANRLKNLVKEIKPQAVIVDMLESVADSIDWFANNKEPDLVLMDVRLTDGLCFEIFSAARFKAPVVFTTAYDEYAIRAFKVNSIDYLLKPVDKQELAGALSKYEELAPLQSNELIHGLADLMKKQEVAYRSRFLIPLHDGYKTVAVHDIDFMFSEFKISHIVLKDGSVHPVLQTMDELEEQLDPEIFFRANRQHIIHVESIKSIHNYFNGKLKVILNQKTDTEIFISREKASSFKHWLDR